LVVGRIGKVTEEYSICDAEDGRGRANTERYCKQGRKRETGSATIGSDCVSDIKPEIFEQWNASGVATVFLDEFGFTQRHDSHSPSLLRILPFCDEVGYVLAQMEAKFLVQLVF
jgi:hypothetical protein